MAGELIRQGDPTSHNGVVLEGSQTDICHGKPIAYLGHKVSCPQCKGTFPIVEGVLTTTFYGKGVAIAGMKTSCGAVLIPTQFTDVIEMVPVEKTGVSEIETSGGPSLAHLAAPVPAPVEDLIVNEYAKISRSLNKRITRLFWTYGERETEVTKYSRHYIDLNLHVETENYSSGETVVVTIADESSEATAIPDKTYQVQILLDSKGHGKIKRMFAGKTVDTTDII